MESHRSDQLPATLLLDADDTLWENNVYFLEVTDELVSVLSLVGVDAAESRQALLSAERESIQLHGYGSRGFAWSVVQVYRQLAPQPDDTTASRLYDLAQRIFLREEIELRPGAEEVVRELSRCHRLVLVTKGDPDEQSRKLHLSGLGSHFEWVEIVPEKDERAYRDLVKRLELDPERTWMIGNSPRSDINPAVAAGLYAILIPHPSTWELEIEDIVDPHGRVTIAHSLRDLLDRFGLPRP